MNWEAQLRVRDGERRSGNGRPLAAFVLLLFVFCCFPAHANTSVFANAGTACTATSWCQALSQFGLLTGAGDTFTTNGGTTWNGGIGIQTGGVLKMTGGNTVANDLVDYADTIKRINNNTCGTNNLCGTGTLNSQNTTTTTKPVTNNSLVTAAGTQLTNIEKWLDGFNSSTYNVAVPTTSGTRNIETNAYNAGNNIYVYRTGGSANYSQSNSGTGMVFNCGGSAAACSDDLLIIVLGTSGTVTFQNNITLGDGLSPDQVLFYIPSASAVTFTIGTNGTYTFNGDFFFKSTQTVTMSGGNNRNLAFNGRLYGAGFTDSNTSSITQNDAGMYTPEPGTWASLAGGVTLLVLLHRRRKNRPEGGAAGAR